MILLNKVLNYEKKDIYEIKSTKLGKFMKKINKPKNYLTFFLNFNA